MLLFNSDPFAGYGQPDDRAGIGDEADGDTGVGVRLPPAGEGVTIQQQQDDGVFWAEARWDSR